MDNRHSWSILASDRQDVRKSQCKKCQLMRIVYPGTPIPKTLWLPRVGKPFYGKTPECV